MKKQSILTKVMTGILGYTIAVAASSASAASNASIIGYLSNFDVYNNTGSAMEGFEVDIENSSTADLYGTYAYSAFGPGTGYNVGTTLAVVHDGKNSSSNPYSGSADVVNGGLTHFGIHLLNWPSGNISYNWLNRGVDGSLYVAGTNQLAAGQPIPPAPVPVPPAVQQATVVTPEWAINASTNTLSAVITNNTNHPIWVQGVSAEDNASVTLDQLMSTDPLFTSLTMAEAQLLEPGDKLTEAGDILASTIGGRAMFWVYGYSGNERLSNVNSKGENVYNADCGAAGCLFADTQGLLQSRVMSSVDLGVAAVPEPETYAMFMAGLGLIGFASRRKQ